MRPQGEVRQALSQAAFELAAARTAEPVRAACGTPMVAFTWREMAAVACVGFEAAKQTVINMTRAGELHAVGQVRVAGSRRPMFLYAPSPAARGSPLIDSVMRDWARG